MGRFARFRFFVLDVEYEWDRPAVVGIVVECVPHLNSDQPKERE